MILVQNLIINGLKLITNRLNTAYYFLRKGRSIGSALLVMYEIKSHYITRNHRSWVACVDLK